MAHLDLSEERHICVNSMPNVAQLYIKHGFTKSPFDMVVCKGPINDEIVNRYTCEGVEVRRITLDNLPLFMKYTSNILKNCDMTEYFRSFLGNEQVVACVALRPSVSGDEGNVCLYKVKGTVPKNQCGL